MILAQFLVEAKGKTYASGGEGGEKIKEDGCKELMFEKDNFKYRDRYYGGNPFIGEEVVFKNDKVIWALDLSGNYLLLQFSTFGKIYFKLFQLS